MQMYLEERRPGRLEKQAKRMFKKNCGKKVREKDKNQHSWKLFQINSLKTKQVSQSKLKLLQLCIHIVLDSDKEIKTSMWNGDGEPNIDASKLTVYVKVQQDYKSKDNTAERKDY